VVAGRSRTSVLGLLDDITRKFSSKLNGTSVFIPAVIVVLAFASGVSWPQEFAADAVPMKLVEKHLTCCRAAGCSPPTKSRTTSFS